MQSTRSLLTCRSAGLHVDVAPPSRAPSDRFTNSFFDSSDDLGAKHLVRPSPASSSADVDTLPNQAPPPSDLRGILSAWASKLRPLPKGHTTTHPSQLTSKKNDPSPMPSAVVHRKPLHRAYSYEQGDDKTTPVHVPKGPFLKETELFEFGSRKFPTESLRVPFTTDKSFEIIKQPVHPKARDFVSEEKEASQSYHRSFSPYETDDQTQLSFDKNEVLLVCTKRDDGWWYAKRLSSYEAGWVPSNFFDVRPIVETLAELPVGGLPRRSRAIRQKKSVNRRAVYGRVELVGAEDIQLYNHFSQQLLSVRECAVCGDSQAIAEFPDQTRLQCKHEWSTCRECSQAWIAAELESKGWDRIKCPEEGCKAFLGHADISQLADGPTFQRYDSLATRAHLNTLPNFRWCLSSTCKSGQIHEDASGPIFKCMGCDMQFCTHHEMPWHHGETCEQYDQRVSREKQDKEERATKKMLKKMTKTCPGRSCGWMIEKNNGCDHMTCRQCRHEFCWICLAAYEPIRRYGNRRHKTTCKYHSDNVK